MLFNSFEFLLIFLPVTMAVFFVVARRSHALAAAWLAGASVAFYGYWNPRFVLLLFISIVFNYGMGYFLGRAGEGSRHGRTLLMFSVAANLVVLGVFKYANFFVSTVNDLTHADIPMLDIVLPLGISFFTFTQIAFLVDVYCGKAREYNFIHYVLFVTYFPHLIAGPILHHKQMMPQFASTSPYRPNPECIAIGAIYLAIGLAKKVLLADSLSEYSTKVFAAAEDGASLQFFEAWAGALAYTLQLYFDFSGYSDMAIGLSKMFGIDLPLNFNSPYQAQSIIEFWRRWHMTLSTFLRDYLYIPLGGNRNGTIPRYMNLMVTMLLGGLWHGANWTFVLWGGLHGFYLVINHTWRALTSNVPSLRQRRIGLLLRIVGTATTFIAVVFAWVFFRAESVSAALIIVKGMLMMNGLSIPPTLVAALGGVGLFAPDGFFPVTRMAGSSFLPLAASGLLIVFTLPNAQELLLSPSHLRFFNILSAVGGPRGYLVFVPGFKAGLFAALLLAMSLVSFSSGSEFLYFQF